MDTKIGIILVSVDTMNDILIIDTFCVKAKN